MTKHKGLEAWVKDMAGMCQPEKVWWCDGSEQEYQTMLRLMVQGGTAQWLDWNKRPNSVFVRSDPADVARVEEFTFIASKSKDDAGPTNNWRDPDELKKTLVPLFTGCMKGRTMFVIPYSMGRLATWVERRRWAATR